MKKQSFFALTIVVGLVVPAAPGFSDSEAVTGKVYFTGYGIQRCNLDGSDVETIVVSSRPVAEVAVDVPAGKVYWLDGQIRRCNFNGSAIEDLVRTQNEPYGIAVGGGKIYWTEISSGLRGKIRRSNLGGSAVEDLVTGLDYPWAIALDLIHNNIYWGSGKDSGKISRADLDGLGVEELITTGLTWPRGIALDVDRGKMYWANFGTDDKIQRANLDGSNIETLISGEENSLVKNPVHLDLDVAGYKMYWTDQFEAGKVQRANLDGSDYEVLVSGDAPHGIAVIPRPEPLTIVAFEIIGPEKIIENYSAQYTGVVYYDNGDTTDVTTRTIWSVEPQTYARIDKKGLLTTGTIDIPEDITIYGLYSRDDGVFQAQMTVQVSLPVSLEILGPRGVSESFETQYNTTVHYGNGNTSKVTNLTVWRVEPESVATIDANGVLYPKDIDVTQAVTIYAEYTTSGISLKEQVAVQVLPARTWHVPSECPTIQAAIDIAEDGDRILVAAGTYAGLGNRDIDFHGKPVTVRSENGAETCIIDLNGTETDPHRGFYFHSRENEHSVLEGFTIKNGFHGHGVGICCCDSSPTIINCVIRDNTGSKWSKGGGICCARSSPVLTGCTIKGNWAYNGGGMGNWHSSSPVVTNCTFSANIARNLGGGMINSESNPTVVNCMFIANSTTSSGGGMSNGSESNPKVINCTFSGNRARSESGGVYNWGYGNATLTNCILWDNLPSEISCSASGTVVVTYSDIKGGWEGERNIDPDPCFVQSGYWDANGTPDDTGDDIWIAGDYHLLPASPCINAGDPNYLAAPNETDIDGQPRVIGGRIDMGAYEFNYIGAEMKFTPHALNSCSNGRWVKAHLVLPEGFTPEDVDANTPATVGPFGIESEYMNVLINEDGLVEIEIAFDRAAFCGATTDHGFTEVTVIGLLTSGQYFGARDTIKIINKGVKCLAVLASHWLETDCGQPDWCDGVDINQDSIVNFTDLAFFDGCCIEVAGK